MKIAIVIKPDMTVGFFAQDGTFVEGQANIARLLEQATGLGMQVKELGQPEQHRPDDPVAAHIHNLAHQHPHQ